MYMQHEMVSPTRAPSHHGIEPALSVHSSMSNMHRNFPPLPQMESYMDYAEPEVPTLTQLMKASFESEARVNEEAAKVRKLPTGKAPDLELQPPPLQEEVLSVSVSKRGSLGPAIGEVTLSPSRARRKFTSRFPDLEPEYEAPPHELPYVLPDTHLVAALAADGVLGMSVYERSSWFGLQKLADLARLQNLFCGTLRPCAMSYVWVLDQHFRLLIAPSYLEEYTRRTGGGEVKGSGRRRVVVPRRARTVTHSDLALRARMGGYIVYQRPDLLQPGNLLSPTSADGPWCSVAAVDKPHLRWILNNDSRPSRANGVGAHDLRVLRKMLIWWGVDVQNVAFQDTLTPPAADADSSRHSTTGSQNRKKAKKHLGPEASRVMQEILDDVQKTVAGQQLVEGFDDAERARREAHLVALALKEHHHENGDESAHSASPDLNPPSPSLAQQQQQQQRGSPVCIPAAPAPPPADLAAVMSGAASVTTTSSLPPLATGASTDGRSNQAADPTTSAPPRERIPLHQLFEMYAGFGQGNNKTPELDNSKFAKLTRDCNLLDRAVNNAFCDVSWTKICKPPQRRINYDQFKALLQLISEKKFPHDPEGYPKLVELLELSGGPQLANVTRVSGGGVVARMTDTSRYTGAHKERFDASGKGRGLAGRDRPTAGPGGAVDLAMLLDRKDADVRGRKVGGDYALI